MQPPSSRGSVVRTVAAYAVMILLAVALFLLIRSHGETLEAPEPAERNAVGASAGKGEVLLRVLIALVAVIVVGQFLGAVLGRIGQPPVIGEVIAGILLGPSLLGDWSSMIVSEDAVEVLTMIAQLGVILYMFVIGLELDAGLLGKRVHSTVAISHASIIAPFLLGSALALFLYERLSTSDVPFTSFSLFLGVAMAVTAFPVLARILTDRGLSKTPIGLVALACAATDDATAWCLLAFVVGVARARVDESLMVAVWAVAYVAAMLLVVRPVLLRLLPRGDAPVRRSTLGVVFALLLLSALATEAIGIHALFGAFLFGAIIPHDSPVARTLGQKLEDVVTLVLLPAFFAVTGMKTQVGLVEGVEAWLILGLIVAVATLGKVGGTMAAARLTGMSWRDSAALGALMNTRGLMGLIVLKQGLDMKVISPTLFTMMVLMALVTTVATAPALHFLLAARSPSPENTESGAPVPVKE